MLRKSATLLLLVMLVPMVINAQTTKRSFIPMKPILQNEVVSQDKSVSNPGKVTADGNYVLIDLMSNAYGPAIGTINPLAFDPYSGTVAFAHRGASSYGASGQVWYNMSTDFGLTWTRVAGINAAAAAKNARYPSMSISNPTHGPLSATTGVFAWPELIGGGFGGVGYGADQPLGAAATFSEIVDPAAFSGPLYSSQVPTFVGDTSPEVYWISDNQTNGSFDVWRTTDFGTVERTNILADTTRWGGGNCIGGVSLGNTTYVGFIGTFSEVHNATGWGIAYIKTTDDGATWSDFKVADWTTVPALAKYDVMFDAVKGDAFVTYQADINVDKDGHVHFMVPLTDTTADWTAGVNAVCDLYETATGWGGNVVYEGLVDSAFANGPGLGQMGACAYLAFDSTRTVEVAQWVNAGKGGLADVFISYKGLNDAAWSTPVNLTNSDTVDNTQAHLAPSIRKDGDNYTAFSMYGYPVAGHDPATASDAYGLGYTFTYVATGINDPVTTVNNYSLSQNYPNPFNPSTSFTYSVAEKGMVSLKVYDVLGKEVATLVNGEVEKGNHTVNFNASNLASGLYIYTLKAGSTNITKKMMLMK